jgi:hypothetical protein
MIVFREVCPKLTAQLFYVFIGIVLRLFEYLAGNVHHTIDTRLAAI